MRFLTNNRGIFHLHLLTLSFFFLSLVGAWHLYSSYKQNRLGSEMTNMLNDYKGLTMQAITNAPDRAKVERNLDEVKQILNKTKAAGGNDFYGLEAPYKVK